MKPRALMRKRDLSRLTFKSYIFLWAYGGKYAAAGVELNEWSQFFFADQSRLFQSMIFTL